MIEYTEHDVAIAVEAYRDIREHFEVYDGAVLCVFSWGYGDVYGDGDVVARRQVVFTVNEDGEVT